MTKSELAQKLIMVRTIQKNLVISLLSNSFADSHRIISMLRSSQRKHLLNFFNYIYVFVEQFGQIFISQNQSTVLLYFQYGKRGSNLKTLYAKAKLLLFSLSVKNLVGTLKFNAFVTRTRTKAAHAMGDSDYIYVWFLAGKEQARSYSGLYEAMEYLKLQYHFNGVPIYIETVVPRMVAIYQRAGFKFYAQEAYGNQLIWFAKYEGYEK